MITLSNTLSVSAIIVALANTAFFLGVIGQRVAENAKRSAKNELMVEEQRKSTQRSFDLLGGRINILEGSNMVNDEKFNNIKEYISREFTTMNEHMARLEALIQVMIKPKKEKED